MRRRLWKHSHVMANRGVGLVVFLLSILALSCNVKEDRRACPCLLSVHLHGPGPMEYRIEDTSGSVLAAGSVPGDTVILCDVPRNRVRVLAVSGAPLGDGVEIPYGSESPPLYLYHGWVLTDGEALRAEVNLHKHYCRLHLELDGPPGEGEPVEVRVRGQVNGIGLDGRPASGGFSCPVSEGSCLLPRQGPSDLLLLDIVMQDRVVRTFSLGTYIREAGFDWTEKDLGDITITLSLSVTQITFRIQDWSVTESINVEI